MSGIAGRFWSAGVFRKEEEMLPSQDEDDAPLLLFELKRRVSAEAYAWLQTHEPIDGRTEQTR